MRDLHCAGDHIVAINGRPVGETRIDAVEEIFQRPGDRVVVSVERDGKRFDATMKLRRLI